MYVRKGFSVRELVKLLPERKRSHLKSRENERRQNKEKRDKDCNQAISDGYT